MSQQILIIGAGPGGLAAAEALKRHNIPFEIVDKGSQPGGIWDIARSDSPMYESAHFISSKTLSGFNDFPMPDHYPDYPKHDQILSYIKDYATHHQLDSFITFNREVNRLIPLEEGKKWEAIFNDGISEIFSGVICATGLTWYEYLPEFPGTFEGEQYHSRTYTKSESLSGKRVLIIGAGNSGVDIACDAARVADKAFISLRRGYYFIPKYVMGMPADVYNQKGPNLPYWLDRRISEFLLNKLIVGNLENYGLPKPDHKLLESHPIMNTQILHYLGHGDIEARKAVKLLKPHSVVFEDDSEEQIDLIIYATGYERIFPFIDNQYMDYKKDRLDFYLEIFHRRFDNLFFIGGFETDGAAYGLFGKQGELIARFVKAKYKEKSIQEFTDNIKNSYPNLHGSHSYIDSQRHKYYVQHDVYQKLLDKNIKRFTLES